MTIHDNGSRVVTESDLLQVERELRRWLIGIVGALILAALSVGVTYADLQNKVLANAQRIEEVREEGSLPLNQMRLDIAVIKEQQRANTLMLNAIASKLHIDMP